MSFFRNLSIVNKFLLGFGLIVGVVAFLIGDKLSPLALLTVSLLLVISVLITKGISDSLVKFTALIKGIAAGKLGTPIELDDFGTGYSSLAYLQRLPVATVKLDRSFIRTIDASPSTQAVVRAAIDMAHALGKSVVAEGVENAEQLALLSQMKCDMMQGYYLSPPVPAAEFAQFVRAKSKTQIRLAHPIVA